MHASASSSSSGTAPSSRMSSATLKLLLKWPTPAHHQGYIATPAPCLRYLLIYRHCSAMTRLANRQVSAASAAVLPPLPAYSHATWAREVLQALCNRVTLVT